MAGEQLGAPSKRFIQLLTVKLDGTDWLIAVDAQGDVWELAQGGKAWERLTSERKEGSEWKADDIVGMCALVLIASGCLGLVAVGVRMVVGAIAGW